MPSESLRRFVVPVFIPHAGCRHRCSFCNQHVITAQPSARPAPDQVRRSIEQFLTYRRQSRQPTQIAFYGGNFLGLPLDSVVGYLKIAADYVAAGKADGIRFSTRPDTISEPILSAIQPFPVTTIELGVQSMDDAVLERICRGHDVAATESALRLLSVYPYEIGVQLMVGLPGEQEASVLRGAAALAAYNLHLQMVRIYPTLVLKDSPLAQEYVQGRYRPLTLDAAVQLTARLYRLFSGHGIRVVRMGLQASEALDRMDRNDGPCLAGPYHPAFGHLVFSHLCYQRIAEQIEACALQASRLTVRVHPRDESQMRGLKNANIRQLKKRYGLIDLKILIDPGACRHKPDLIWVD